MLSELKIELRILVIQITVIHAHFFFLGVIKKSVQKPIDLHIIVASINKVTVSLQRKQLEFVAIGSRFVLP